MAEGLDAWLIAVKFCFLLPHTGTGLPGNDLSVGTPVPESVCW